jgi:hypothetical protein
MRTRRPYPIAILVAALVTLACSGDANECDPTGVAFSAADVLSVSAAESDPGAGWRRNIDELVASAPPDSIVKAGVLYKSAVTDADRALLNELDAHISYEFTSVPALTVHITVAGLPILAGLEAR